MNIYELLYEWMKRTDRSTWNAHMQSMFTDTNVPFDVWWEANEEYLHDYKNDQWAFEEIRSAKEFDDHLLPDNEREICVFINLWNTKDALTKAFAELLKEKHPGTVGRPKHENWADFEMNQKTDEPTLKMLEMMLSIYDLRKNTSLKLWEIGVLMNVNPSQIPAKRNTHAEKVAKKAILNSTVSRYVMWAETLRKNLAHGNFPKYRKSQP